MTKFYAIKSKYGEVRCGVGRDLMLKLTREYLGNWENVDGESCYVFRESVSYGNNDIVVLAWPGDYIGLEKTF